MFEAAIFDWDGTLADTRKVIVTSFQKALREIDCKANSEFIQRRIGIGAAETFRETLRSAKRPFNQQQIEQLVERKSAIEIELTPKIALFQGATELLLALRGKLRVGLASMNNRTVIEHSLQYLNLDECFQVVLTAESINQSKPNPEIFLKTAVKLKTKPQKCVVFEDSIFGVEAAKSANMSCIAVTTGVYKKEELQAKKADLIVESLQDARILQFVLQ
jgi:HAD superfamily hydrolase (TIGR01509 family)